MKRLIEEIRKLPILFIIGAIVYMAIELLYRGFTHWTMGVVGGLCFIIIGGINNYFKWSTPVWLQCTIGGFVVTTIEFISGVLLNIVLKLNIWDYSAMPFNILGQICLPFYFIWILLSLVAILLDDYLRWKLFKEPIEKYKWF